MKAITLLLFFSAQIIFSQHINSDKIDDFDGLRKINVSIEDGNKAIVFFENILKAGGISASFELKCNVNPKNNNKYTYITFQFNLGSIRCFRDSKIVFLFENENQTTLKQVSKIDCGQTTQISYELFDSDIFNFLNYKVKKVRIYTTEGYIDADIKPNKTQKIIDTFILYKMTIPQ